MSLERAIHERWRADYVLSAALPVERLFTGTARGDETPPYAIVERRENQVLARTSSGTSIDRVVLRIGVYAARLDHARQIAAAVAARFDRAEFPLDSGRVLNMQGVGDQQTESASGLWLVETDFAVIVVK